MMLNALITKFQLDRFFVGEGSQPSPYKLTQRRVYILPTKQGLGFALLLFIMLLGSINYNTSLGYFLTFLLASMGIVTMLHSYNNLLKLEVGPAQTGPVFAGETVHLYIKVNNQNHAARYALFTFTDQQHCINHIPANQISRLELIHRFDQRGYQPLPRFTLESCYPLGLFRAWSIIELDQQQLVYPAPSADTQLPLHNDHGGDGDKATAQGNDDFRGLRSHIPGDPLQHIHWKSAARHNTLQTKEFGGSAAQELCLDWQRTTAKTVEEKISQLTRWVLLAEQANLPFALQLPGLHIASGHSPQHTAHCLQQLALYGLPYAD